MNFGDALNALKEGKKVARQGWNGKGMFLYYVSEGAYTAKTAIAEEIADESGLVAYGAYVAIKSVSGVVYIWNPSQQDLFAEDWVVID